MKKILTNKIILFLFSTVAILLSCTLLLIQTSSYKVDKISYSLSNYNKINHYQKYNPSALRVSKNKFTEEESVRSYFTNLDNWLKTTKFPKDTRRLISNETYCFNYPVQILNQQTYSIKTSEDKTQFIVDGGKISTYFDSNFLPNRQMVSARFDCDTFIFISDQLADKLLTKYNLSKYEELINIKENAVLPIVENGRVLFTASINNIIKSNELSGPRLTELYGDYGYSYFSDTWLFKSRLILSYEIEFKVDPYGTSKVIKQLLNSEDYQPSKCEYLLLTPDKDGKYVDNPELTVKLLEAGQANDVLLIILAISILFIYSVLVILFYDKIFTSKKERKLIVVIYLILFCLYGVIGTFVYINWLISIFPLLLGVLYLVLFNNPIFEYSVYLCKERKDNND